MSVGQAEEVVVVQNGRPSELESFGSLFVYGIPLVSVRRSIFMYAIQMTFIILLNINVIFVFKIWFVSRRD